MITIAIARANKEIISNIVNYPTTLSDRVDGLKDGKIVLKSGEEVELVFTDDFSESTDYAVVASTMAPKRGKIFTSNPHIQQGIANTSAKVTVQVYLQERFNPAKKLSIFRLILNEIISGALSDKSYRSPKNGDYQIGKHIREKGFAVV